MAWSPQARAAAAAARKRKGHTTSARHVNAKYTVTAKHPGRHSQFKAKAKKVAKYTAVAGAVGAASYVAAKGGKKAVSNKVRNDARKRLQTKGHAISDIRTARTFAKKGSNAPKGSLAHTTHLHTIHHGHVGRSTVKQINRYKKRTPHTTLIRRRKTYR